MVDTTGKSTIEQIRAKNRETADAADAAAADMESPKDEAPQGESALARMEREAEESAKKQEEQMHKKNIGLGGVNAGKL